MKKKERKNLKKLYKSNKFCDILQINRGITAVIGSGGKTSLIGRMCSELADSGSVIFTTTTHILRPDDMPVAESLSRLDEIIADGKSGTDGSGYVNKTGSANRIICIGSNVPDNPRKLSVPNVSMEALADRADYVLVEADGSKMLPVKAHKYYEPVIPQNSNTVILVVGLSGIGGKVAEKVHRIEEFETLTGAKPDDTVTAELIAAGIVSEMPNYRDFNVSLYLNQTDIEDGEGKARELAEAFRNMTKSRSDVAKCKIFAGSLREGYIYEL